MMAIKTNALHENKEKGNAANVAFGNQIDHWSGFSFNFLRCRCLSCFSTDFGNTCSGFFSTSAGGEPLGSFTMCQSAESTLDFLRCRRLISLFAAVIKKPAVLSPSSLTCSISSRSSSGSLTETCKDLLFFLPVAITESHNCRWCSVCTKKVLIQMLTWCSPVIILVVFTISIEWFTYCEAQPDGRPSWASNHNVSEAYIMACLHDTQTRPEFTYLFLGTPSDLPTSTPVVLRAEADAEELARAHFPGWDLVFAAQIRTKAPCRLQLFDGNDHFSWIFEQRFDGCTSGAQEVAHG